MTIGGIFEKGVVNGKGFKKWQKGNDIYNYRGDLMNSQIQGFGIFRWPDSRNYIGDFVNMQMHGKGKFSWTEEDGTKVVYKGEMFAN